MSWICNVLLVSIPSKSIYHPIFRQIVDGTLELIISNEILLEYMEVIAMKASPDIATDVVDMLIGNPATIKAEPFYKFNLITGDPVITNMPTLLFPTMPTIS